MRLVMISSSKYSSNTDSLDFEETPKFCSTKRLLSGFLIMLISSLCVAGLVHLILKGAGEFPDKQICSEIPDLEKFDCYPDSPAIESECHNRGCCYDSLPKEVGTPKCYFPSNYVGYKINNITWSDAGCAATLSKVGRSGFQNDVKNLLLSITFIDDNSLRLKITDSDFERFEVPIPLQYKVKPRTNPQYDVNLTPDGTLVIDRRSTNTSVFKTKLSQLIYSDQFLQLSTYTSSSYLYGIGEHKGGVLKSFNWTRWTLFNQGDLPTPDRNLYGTHPFYVVLEEDGTANGAFLYNSNAMDVILLPTPAVTFRPIGGILDFFILLGPTPKDVIQQYTSIVGQTFMPPYWSLGFHLCRYGYNSLNNTKAVYQRMLDAGIPYDVQWNDIDYMEKYMDFTYDKVRYEGLPEFVEELHNKGMHYVVMIDPGVSNSEENGTYPPYDDGVAKDLFVKNISGQYFEGKVWNTNATVFPDFSNPATESYWIDQFIRFYSEVAVDGIWIDMNEPASFYNGQIDGCPTSPFEDPQYLPGGKFPLRTMTVCMTAKHFSTIHYNEHNLLSYREAKATNLALRKIRENKRPFIISRATFTGQGLYSGHWSGDISSNWGDLRYTIPSMLTFNLYGISMIGSDICGFVGNTTEELCARWQTLGAFYPFSRNHNDYDTIEQDPVAMGPIVTEAAKKTLTLRYYLLPYLYTLFYRSHIFGETVARPLFFEFSTDVKTFAIDEQFLWGPALMIIPALYPNVTEVTAYFPKGLWYDFETGESRSSEGQEYTLPAPLTSINLAVRGGHILPLQRGDQTTTESRKNGFDLYVALDEKKEADGELYWDDGDTLDTYENGIYNLIQFSVKSNVLKTTIVKSGYATNMTIDNIRIYGVEKSPSQVKINDEAITTFEFNKNCLSIHTKGFSLLDSLTVTWS